MTGSTQKRSRGAGQVSRMTPGAMPGAAAPRRRRSRGRAKSKYALLSKGYVFFLALVCIACVFMCIRYLKLKETITTQVKQNNALRSELVTKRAENDALHESIENSVDLRELRNRAIEEFGMKYATEDQVIWYNGTDNGYVEQYQDVS